MNPEQIMDIQRKLAAQSLYSGKIDGVIGPETKAAIEVMRARQDRAAEQEAQAKAQEAEARAAEARAKEAEAQAERERQQTEREAAERAPGRQAMEAAKLGVPIIGGAYGGHAMASGVEARQLASEASGRIPMTQSVARRFAPYGARAGTYFIPEGLALREWLAPQIENQTARELTRAGGTGLMAAGAGLAGEGIYKSLTPQAVPGMPQTPISSPPLPQSRPPALPQTPIQTNAQTLISAAREAGATGKLNKMDAAKFLKKKGAITDQNRGAVARALRVNPGPNFTDRIAKKIKGLSSTRTRLPSLAGPLIAGGLAYDIASSDAEARGMTPTERTTRGLAAGGAGAGFYEGGRRAFNALERLAPNAMRALGGSMAATLPVAAADAYSPDQAELNRDRNIAARNMPSWMRGGYVEDAYQMAQVPEQNPQSMPEGADPDVAKAWRKSPRRTIIELSRNSGLDANDIATLAGVDPGEVTSIMSAIPQRAMEMQVSP